MNSTLYSVAYNNTPQTCEQKSEESSQVIGIFITIMRTRYNLCNISQQISKSTNATISVLS